MLHKKLSYKAPEPRRASAIAFLVLLLSLCVIVPYGLNDIAAFTFLLTFYCLGLLSCFYLSNNKDSEFKKLLAIFHIASAVYFFYSYLATINYESIGDFFIFPDQAHFYGVSESLKVFPSVWSIFKHTIIEQTHRENEAMHFLTGAIAYIAEKYLSGNSLILQRFVVASFAVFINVFIYKTLRFYVPGKPAFRYTVIFSLLSVTFAYSPWILRDIHIMFFYVVGFYLIHKEFSLANILLLFVLQYIVSEFRVASGLAFFFFPLFYLYFKGSNYKYRKIIYLFLLVAFIFILIKSFGAINSTINKLNNYQTFTEDAVSSIGGISTYLYRLPAGIKQLAIMVFSQIQPFPPWGDIEDVTTVFEVLSKVFFGAAAVFWSYVAYITIVSFGRHHTKIPKTLLYGVIFSFLLLLANTSNMNIRRIMAVYPILFIFFVYAQVHLNTCLVKKHRRFYFFFGYLFLLLSYGILKY